MAEDGDKKLSKEGWLEKKEKDNGIFQVGVSHKWTDTYLVVQKEDAITRKELPYFQPKGGQKSRQKPPFKIEHAAGFIKIANISSENVKEYNTNREWGWSIRESDGKFHYMASYTKKDRDEWMNRIKNIIKCIRELQAMFQRTPSEQFLGEAFNFKQ